MFGDFDEGVLLLLDKPYGWTSADLVRKVKNLFKIKKIGHAGTLDPLASGMMILCTGKWTKKLDSFQALEKEYTGVLRLGEHRPSYDLETEILETKACNHITIDDVKAAAKQLTGIISQVPPLYSAVKINGKRAYEYARSGEQQEIKSREVTVSLFEIEKKEANEVWFRVVCSKGTYIRSLVRDVGAILECGAVMTELVRSRIGEYTLAKAYNVSQLTEIAKQEKAK